METAPESPTESAVPDEAPNPHDELSTGERIRLLRKRRRMSLRDLAAEASISDTALSEYERDEANASGEVIRRLALTLRTSTDYLLRLSPRSSVDRASVS